MDNQSAQPNPQPNIQPPASMMSSDTSQNQNQENPQPTQSNQPNEGSQPESLAEQNIFNLLGVTDGTTEEREEFLDELQQVIWEDFLEYDAKLLVTSEEYEELQKILNSTEGDALDNQESAIVYLEKLIPELEEIMLEKALELKADLLRERVAGMKEYYSGNTEAMQKIERAEELILQERWYSAAELLNGIS